LKYSRLLSESDLAGGLEAQDIEIGELFEYEGEESSVLQLSEKSSIEIVAWQRWSDLLSRLLRFRGTFGIIASQRKIICNNSQL
jgi:hypothetical protein